MNFAVHSGQITNLEAIRPGYPMFTNKYLEICRGFNTHRFMYWAGMSSRGGRRAGRGWKEESELIVVTATNGNAITDWAQRTPLNALQYSSMFSPSVLSVSLYIKLPPLFFYWITNCVFIQMERAFLGRQRLS